MDRYVMMSGGPSESVASPLLGVELGRSKVRLVLMDASGSEVDDVVEQSIAKGGGPRDPIDEELSTRSAIEAGLDRLGIHTGSALRVGATIGFTNCGVGSGPELRDWLGTLSDQLNEPVVCTRGAGVSYAPASCLEFVRRVFESTSLVLDRVELAPVAAARTLGQAHSVAVTLGSGVAWSARILNDEVLEAFETTGGAIDEPLHVLVNGVSGPLDHLVDIAADDSLCRRRGMTIGSLAPSVGVAVALLAADETNLLQGEPITTVADIAAAEEHDFESQLGTGGASARVINDPYELHGRPVDVAHRREGPRRKRPLSPTGQIPIVQGRQEGANPDGIEAFADHDVEDPRFNISDFVLGALGMLAIVLLITLVLL